MQAERAVELGATLQKCPVRPWASPCSLGHVWLLGETVVTGRPWAETGSAAQAARVGAQWGVCVAPVCGREWLQAHSCALCVC